MEMNVQAQIVHYHKELEGIVKFLINRNNSSVGLYCSRYEESWVK